MTDRNREIYGVGWKNGWLISIGVGIGLVYGMTLAGIDDRSIKDPFFVEYLYLVKYVICGLLLLFPPVLGGMYDVLWPQSWWPKRGRQT